MDPKALEKILHDKIPLARAMDVYVYSATDEAVELRCRLEPNHNHLGTAFGGSLSTLMILSAYCWLFRLIGQNGHVLLKKTEAEFFKPVSEELRAICKRPDSKAIEGFLKTYQKKGRARLGLSSEIILQDGSVACRMHGEFVGKPE